jgi:hypothetical protein
VDPANTVAQPPDGNCLFHALGFALGGVEQRKLRREIQAYMRENEQHYALMHDQRLAWETYIESMGQDGFWGGAAEIWAVRELADRPIFILRADTVDVSLVRFLQAAIRAQADPIVLQYTGNHYNNVVLPAEAGDLPAPIRTSTCFLDQRVREAHHGAPSNAICAWNRRSLIIARARITSNGVSSVREQQGHLAVDETDAYAEAAMPRDTHSALSIPLLSPPPQPPVRGAGEA